MKPQVQIKRSYIAAFFCEFALATLIPVFMTATAAFAQEAKPAQTEQMQERIEQLEKQVREMREELSKMRQGVPEKKEAPKPGDAQIKNEVTYVKTASPSEPATGQNQPLAQDKKQIGIDIGNNMKLIPYGTIYFNAFGNSGGVNNTDVPLWAAQSGQSNVSASMRQTRFGARIEGAKIGNARLTGTIEADFFGGFPAIGVGESFGVVRLRLANAKLEWEKTSLIIGQDWMVFAPNNPVSIAAAAIPQMAAAGNPWSRLPQIRLERKFYKKKITWQGALLSPAGGDFPSGTNSPFLLQPGSGPASRVPYLQSRFAFSEPNWFGSKKGGILGLSAHYGRARVTTGSLAVNNEIDSLGIALDWNFPLAKRVGLMGEGFFGRNLAGFQAGIFQGYNNDFAFRQGSKVTPGGVRAIGTRGGWAQLSVTPDVFKDRLTLYGSFGIDDPRNRDLVSLAARDWRTRNLAYAFNFIYKPVPQFSFGAEIRRFETWYLLSQKRSANHLNLGAAYNF